MLNAPAATATTTASDTSFAVAHRARPKPWVNTYRNVPLSNTPASNGAPANAPISAGTA